MIPKSPVVITQVSPKKSGLGRPRGRPPGPKICRQFPKSRNRTSLPSMGNTWNQSSMNSLTYEYQQHYHDAMMRQYLQTLSQQYNQTLTQINSFLPNNTNQANILKQTNMLQGTQLKANSLNLVQNLAQLNPNLLKNVIDMYQTSLPQSVGTQSTPSSVAEQIQLLNSLKQATTNANFLSPVSNIQKPLNIIPSKSAPYTSKTPKQKVFQKATPGVSKTLPPTSVASALHNFNKEERFKYPVTEFSKPKVKDIIKTTNSYGAQVSVQLK